MSTLAALIAGLPQQTVVTLLLLVVLSLGTGFSGLAMSRMSECESISAETELVKVTVTERGSRRRTIRQTLSLPSKIVSAFFSSYSSEQSVYLSATTRTEHTFRNGGIGTPMRC